jgi:hypothetical protein
MASESWKTKLEVDAWKSRAMRAEAELRVIKFENDNLKRQVEELKRKAGL